MRLGSLTPVSGSCGCVVVTSDFQPDALNKQVELLR